MTKRLGIALMIKGARDHVRRVREEVGESEPSEVRSRLWNAEMQLGKAQEAIQRDDPRE